MSIGKEKLMAKQNIFLIGFMASGKSTVGEILAGKLQRKFFDTDKLIEGKAGLSIAQIFQEKGESHFREIEADTVKFVTNKNQAVIALGGGAILDSQNWQMIKSAGYTIYLQWDINLLVPRLMNDDSRPLISQRIKNLNKTEIIKLFNSRKNLYESADYSIKCFETDSPDQITNTIIKLLQLENEKNTCYSRT